MDSSDFRNISLLCTSSNTSFMYDVRSLQVTMDDFELACKGLYRALSIREKYMRLGLQRFPHTVSQYLCDIEGRPWKVEDQVHPGTVYSNCAFVWYLRTCFILKPSVSAVRQVFSSYDII